MAFTAGDLKRLIFDGKVAPTEANRLAQAGFDIDGIVRLYFLRQGYRYGYWQS